MNSDEQFDAWWNPIKRNLYFHTAEELAIATLSARQGWDACAALLALPSLKEEPAVAVGEFTQEDRQRAVTQIEDAHVLSAEHSPDSEWLDVAIDLQCELNRLRALLGEGKVTWRVDWLYMGKWHQGTAYENEEKQRALIRRWQQENKESAWKLVRITALEEVIELRSAPEGESR